MTHAPNTRATDATTHNHHDITFLHNMVAGLEGSTNHARAVITDGSHPDVRALARDVLTSHTDQMATAGRLQRQLGVAATSSSTSSGSSGHGNGNGNGNAYGHNSADLGGEFRSAMSTQSINDLPDSDFAYIEPGGSKDASGKTTPRSLRHFPIHDAAHVRNALSRAPQSPFGEKAMPKIRAAAKRFGITVGDSMNSRPDLGLCVRDFAFEFESRGDGRTLEGYAAVFNTPTRIRDLQGDFEETILPGAFKRSLAERMPILQWDHGKDPWVGTVPIGAIQNLAEDSKGLHVRARLFDNDVVEPVRQAIEARAVRGMSFRFGVPEGGEDWPTRDRREIRDLDAYELGPVAFPAYDTTSVSVRSMIAQLDPTEHRSLLRELAAELRLAADLTDFTGRPALGVGGGDPGTEPGGHVSDLLLRQRIADHDALRLKGILK